jgi:signal transduction histidine kinase
LAEGEHRVRVQAIQIEQVIINLARNAIEAMADLAPDRRRLLTLRTRLPGPGQVEIQVEDTGPGLSQEVAENLFQPFITTKPQGLGLGLSISSGIVATHGGGLRVDSRPGEGALFRFSLPLIDRENDNEP